MDKLNKARQKINEVDKEMARLFVERMNAVTEVVEYKKEHGLPILDTSREQEIVKANQSIISDPTLREFYVSFLKSNMQISRNYQRQYLTGIRVAYCGVEGAFAHIAAKRIFPMGTAVSYDNFDDAYNSVDSGECDVAVLPIENSYAGEVGSVMDLLFFGNLSVNGIYELGIAQNLLGVKGSTTKDIKKVVSHPQALNQCAAFIKKHSLIQEAFENTAMAAKSVAEKGDMSVAAIASLETAELYGLDVLEHDINSSKNNTTRFAVVSRTLNREQKHANGENCVLMFTVKNEAGALAKAINIIGEYGFNMRSLHSRPVKKLMWQYYFYLELEGDITTEVGDKMLDALSSVCDRLKVVGTFEPHINI